MASSTSTATSSWPPRMCACGFRHCVVKISRSTKNPGRGYYVCPRTTVDVLHRLVGVMSFAAPNLVLTSHIMMSIWGYGRTRTTLLMATNRLSPHTPFKSRGNAVTSTQP
ncbi:hypothetical protein CsSME_00004438 [Camellia sinensis var. sinensis]